MAVSCLRVTKPDQIDLIFQLVLADCVFWNLGQKYLGSFFDFIVMSPHWSDYKVLSEVG